VDDDGDGQTDYEDPACCTQTAAMQVKKVLIVPGAGGRDDLSPPAAVSGRERPCRATHRRDHPCAPTSLVYGGVLNNRERRSVVGDQDQGHTQPSDHSPEYDENTTGPCKKMPAPAPPSGARARLASPPCGTSGPEERRRGSELGTTGNAKTRELAPVCATRDGEFGLAHVPTSPFLGDVFHAAETGRGWHPRCFYRAALGDPH